MLALLARFTLVVASLRPTGEDVTTKLEALRADAKLPALAGAIFTRDGLEGAWATGVRANSGSAKVALEDSWHLGSCTKSMTATLIALLVERGDLDWDQPLKELLPECVVTMDKQYLEVTLAQLLSHRAGVTNDAAREGLWASLNDPASKETLTQRRARAVKTVLSWPPVHAPGTKFLYSNYGVVVAGHVAEVVAGKPYEELMRELLFVPLGMKSAGFGPPGTPKEKDAADAPRGHLPGGEAVEPGPGADNPAAIAPAGTVHASLADWAKYLTMHLRGAKGDVKVGAITLKQATFAKLHAPYDAPGDRYAMGWVVDKRDWAEGDKTVLWHNGSNTMWYCVTWLAPDPGFGVLVTTNVSTDASRKAVDDACGVLIREHGTRANASTK